MIFTYSKGALSLINHYKSTILVEYSLYFLIHNASLPIILTILKKSLTIVIYISYLRDLSHVSGKCPLGICLVRSRRSNGMNHPGRPGCLLKSGHRIWQLIWDFMAKMIWIWDFFFFFHEDMGDGRQKNMTITWDFWEFHQISWPCMGI